MADTDKAPKKNSSKMKDKKKQKKTSGVVKDEPLVLTPSEKALGIRITQPKQKTIDTMTRLYAVPSEKLRVWTCWLTKVGERAEDWQWWLRAQIGLTVRISDQLQQAGLTLEKENNEKLGQGDGGTADDTTVPEEVEASATDNEPKIADSDATVVEEAFPDPETPPTTEEVPAAFENTGVPEGKPGDIRQPKEASVAERGRRKGDKDKRAKKGKKTKGAELEPKIMYKEGFWPIGVRWKPLSQQRGERKQPPKRKPDEIPIPKNEEEMAELIKKFKHQGVIYQSFYKHWSETADQAVKQIVGRKVLPTKEVYQNGEESPYFFYLESEPDMDLVVEYDDEEVLLADPGRERITREFTHLYFNLTDKPGKGGKPWI